MESGKLKAWDAKPRDAQATRPDAVKPVKVKVESRKSSSVDDQLPTYRQPQPSVDLPPLKHQAEQHPRVADPLPSQHQRTVDQLPAQPQRTVDQLPAHPQRTVDQTPSQHQRSESDADMEVYSGRSSTLSGVDEEAVLYSTTRMLHDLGAGGRLREFCFSNMT